MLAFSLALLSIAGDSPFWFMIKDEHTAPGPELCILKKLPDIHDYLWFIRPSDIWSVRRSTGNCQLDEISWGYSWSQRINYRVFMTSQSFLWQKKKKKKNPLELEETSKAESRDCEALTFPAWASLWKPFFFFSLGAGQNLHVCECSGGFIQA